MLGGLVKPWEISRFIHANSTTSLRSSFPARGRTRKRLRARWIPNRWDAGLCRF
jgi:hypothetical protein